MEDLEYLKIWREYCHCITKSMKFIRQLDLEAYQHIYAKELFLRKMFRWGLRNTFGRQWYDELGDVTEQLEDRIASDRRLGYYSGNHTFISYIDLRVLISLMFGKFWTAIFKIPFDNKFNQYRSMFEDLIRIRNKIGHFRAVNQKDISTLAQIKIEIDKVINFYSGISNSSSYISGEQEHIADYNGEGIEVLNDKLGKTDHGDLWEFYDSLHAERQNGLSPGIGIISEHIFFEYYTKGCFFGEELYNYCVSDEHVITFLNLGKYGQHARVFIPLLYSSREIKKSIKRFTKAAKNDLQDLDKSPEDLSIKYQLGINEVLNINTINTYSGFIF